MSWEGIERDGTSRDASVSLGRDKQQLELELKYLRSLCPSFDFRSRFPDFESLCTRLDEAAQMSVARAIGFPDIVPEKSYWGQLRARYLRALQVLLCRACDQPAQPGMAAICQFMRGIVGNHESESSVVSFNWDTLIELAADRENMRVGYLPSDRIDLLLLKPHGSLNMVELPLPEFERLQSRRQHFELEHAFQDGNNVTTMLRLTSTKDLEGAGSSSWIDRSTVAPSHRKNYGSSWLKMQWMHTNRVLLRAEQIVVIGFSFPEADLRPLLALQLALHEKEPQDVAVQLVGPNAGEEAKRLQKLLGFPVDPVDTLWELAPSRWEPRSW